METGDLLTTTEPADHLSETAALRVIGVTKSFPGVRALSSANFDCREGEVHALVGENGSGKSTMIKAASGVYDIDEGQIFIGGEELGRGGVQRSRRLGLITAYQDTSLGERAHRCGQHLTVVQRPGRGPTTGPSRVSSRAFDLPFRQSDLVAALGPGARQLLEVARAMAHKPKVLMLDEPTAALDMDLAIKLEEIIKRARDEGTAIVYVSHRLEEVRRLADRLTVIRDGEIQGTYGHSELAGRGDRRDDGRRADIDLEFPTRTRPVDRTTRLEVHDLTGRGLRPGLPHRRRGGDRRRRGGRGQRPAGTASRHHRHRTSPAALSRRRQGAAAGLSGDRAASPGISFQSGDRVSGVDLPGRLGSRQRDELSWAPTRARWGPLCADVWCQGSAMSKSD